MTQDKTIGFIVAAAIVLGFTRNAGTAERRISIAPGDMTSLEAVLADPANSGAIVVLASGVYVLQSALELQPNMQLVGANRYHDVDGDGVWDARDSAGAVFADPASETIVDGSLLAADFIELHDCDGAVHASLVGAPLLRMTGGNVVRSLTVRGAPGTAIAPTVDAQRLRGDGVDFKVTDTLFVGNFLGIGAIHHDCTFRDAHSDATIERNVFLDNTGAAILFSNTLAQGARWRGLVRNNRSSRSGIGMALSAGGAACDLAEIRVESVGNVVERNSLGVLVYGGRDFGNAAPGLLTGGRGNLVEWTSHGDAIWNNGQLGGIRVQGSFSTQPAALPSENNSVRVTLLETRFIQAGAPAAIANRASGERRDVTLSGGNGGMGNEIRILPRRVSSDGAVGAFAIVETPGNVVSVVGSDVAFVHANEDMSLPILEP